MATNNQINSAKRTARAQRQFRKDCSELIAQMEAVEQQAHELMLYPAAKKLNEAKNTLGYAIANAMEMLDGN